LDWINKTLQPFIQPWAEGEVKNPPFAFSAQDLLAKATLNKYDDTLTAEQMELSPSDRKKVSDTTFGGFTNDVTRQIFLHDNAFYKPGLLVGSLFKKSDLPAYIVHEMFHAFGLKEAFVEKLNPEIQKNCGWGGNFD
jgi:hypothetical protein